jgi:hypothetical protein
MTDGHDGFRESLKRALEDGAEAALHRRDPALVARMVINGSNSRQRRGWIIPSMAAASVLVVAVVVQVFAPGANQPGAQAPVGGDITSPPPVVNEPGDSDAAPDVADGPPDSIFGIDPETVVVDGVTYRVAIARGFSPPSGLVRAADAVRDGESRAVFQMPGVSKRAALLMETEPGEGDDLGAYPPYLLLIGPESPYPALCDRFASTKAPPECE